MDRQEEISTAIVGRLDNLAQVCIVGCGFVHCGIVDGVTELREFGDEGFYDSTVDLTLTKALVFGSVPRTSRRVPCIDGYSYGQHLLSLGFKKVVNIKDKQCNYIIPRRRVPSCTINFI